MSEITKQFANKSSQQQKGAVLIVGLIMLFVMTLISISSMSGSVLEERMSSNFKDRQTAFQAAEAALRQGERLTVSNQLKSSYTTTCTGGLCLADIGDAPTVYPDYATNASPSVWISSATHITYSVYGTATPAKIIIEYMGCNKKTNGITCVGGTDKNIFRVTALGYGQSANAQVMLQSTFIP